MENEKKQEESQEVTEEKQAKPEKEVVSYAKYRRELDELAAERDALKAEIGNRDQQIADLTQAAESNDVDGLRKQLEDATKANEDYQAQAVQRETALKRDYALDTELIRMGVRNAKAARALINLEDVTLTEEGSLEGVDLASLKADNPYLFDAPKPQDAGGAPKGSVDNSADASIRAGAGL